MNKTEEMEAKIREFRKTQFENAHRILICLENKSSITDRKQCLFCKDTVWCNKFRDIIGR